MTVPDPPISKRPNPGNDSHPIKHVKLDIDPATSAGPSSELSTIAEDNKLGNRASKPKKEKNISRRRDAGGWPKSRKGKEPDGKNAGRRRGPRNEEWGSRAGCGCDEPRFPRLPKRQCALLIGFCGTGCNGMQMYAMSFSVVRGSIDLTWNTASLMFGLSKVFCSRPW